MKIFVCLGNLDYDLQISEDRKKKAVKICRVLALKLSELVDVEFLYAGRKKSYSSYFFNELLSLKGVQWCKNRVTTYIPKNIGDIDDNEFEFIGRKVLQGNFIEDRRKLIVKDSDIILISGGGRAINTIPEIAKRMNKTIVPIPLGLQPNILFEFDNFSKKYSFSKIEKYIKVLEDYSTDINSFAYSCFEIIKALILKK